MGLDNVVTGASHRLQIEPDQQRRSYARDEVEVHERLDGSLAVYSGQRCLATSPAPERAADLRARKERGTAPTELPDPKLSRGAP